MTPPAIAKQQLPALKCLIQRAAFAVCEVGKKRLRKLGAAALNKGHLCGYPVSDIAPRRTLGLLAVGLDLLALSTLAGSKKPCV